MGAYFLKKQARSPILEGFGRNIYALLSFSGQQYFYTKHEADTEELSGVRLLAYLYNNFHAELYKPKVYWTKDRKKRRRSRISVTCECPFTGVVSDEIILQPLMDFMRSPDTRNFKELMRDCLENFFRSCRDDCEYCESEEYFTDESHRNNWEYLIDGTLFKETA